MTEITVDKVRAELKFIIDRAKDIARKGTIQMPTILVICRRSPLTGEPLDPSKCVVPVMLATKCTKEAKDEMVSQARTIAIAGDAFAAITCVSTSAVVASAGLKPEEVTTHPNRREAIVGLLEWASGDFEVSVTMVTRDQGFVDFDEVVDVPISASAFDPILVRPDTTVPPDILAMARELSASYITTTAQREAMQQEIDEKAARDLMAMREVPRG